MVSTRDASSSKRIKTEESAIATFVSDEAEESYRKNYKNKLILERGLVAEKQSTIRSAIEALGWKTFCETTFLTLPNLVREFYANGPARELNEEARILDVCVRGKMVRITPQRIRTAYNLRDISADLYNAYVDQPGSLESVIAEIGVSGAYWNLGSIDNSVQGLDRKMLNRDARIWNDFICNRIRPTLQLSYIPLSRARLIFDIMTERPVEPSLYIFDGLVAAIRNNRKSFPFPGLISQHCLHSIEVSSKEEILESPKPVNDAKFYLFEPTKVTPQRAHRQVEVEGSKKIQGGLPGIAATMDRMSGQLTQIMGALNLGDQQVIGSSSSIQGGLPGIAATMDRMSGQLTQIMGALNLGGQQATGSSPSMPFLQSISTKEMRSFMEDTRRDMGKLKRRQARTYKRQEDFMTTAIPILQMMGGPDMSERFPVIPDPDVEGMSPEESEGGGPIISDEDEQEINAPPRL